MKLREPTELDVETRAIIEAARGGHDPSELQRARVRRGVEVKLAAGIALAVGPASSAIAGVAKLTAAVVAVGTVVGAGVYVYPHVTAKQEMSRPAARVAARAPAAPIAAPPMIEEMAPAVAPARAVSKRRVAPAPAPIVESASSLKEETALLAGANAALGRGDVARALALLEEYDRRPGSGVLAEERTVTGILVSCAARRVDAAHAEARHFRARWPRSPLAARVDASCASRH
jgi:hypothetical protein